MQERTKKIIKAILATVLSIVALVCFTIPFTVGIVNQMNEWNTYDETTLGTFVEHQYFDDGETRGYIATFSYKVGDNEYAISGSYGTTESIPDTTTVYFVSSNPQDATVSQPGSQKVGAIIGIVLICCFPILVWICVYFGKQKKRKGSFSISFKK